MEMLLRFLLNMIQYLRIASDVKRNKTILKQRCPESPFLIFGEEDILKEIEISERQFVEEKYGL